MVRRGIQYRREMEFPGECYETSAEFPCASINSWPDAHIHVVWHGRAEGGEFTLLTLLEIILQIISSFALFLITYVS